MIWICALIFQSTYHAQIEKPAVGHGIGPGELPQYLQAAKMAAQTYGINLPADPVGTPELELQFFQWKMPKNPKSKNLYITCYNMSLVCKSLTYNMSHFQNKRRWNRGNY